MSPIDPPPRSFVAQVEDLIGVSRIEEARDLCARGVERHPRWVPGWLAMGRVLATLGQEEDARAWLGAVLEVSPGHRGARALLDRLRPPSATSPPPPQARQSPAPARLPEAPAARGPAEAAPVPFSGPTATQSLPHAAPRAEVRPVPEAASPSRRAEADDSPSLASETLGDLYAQQGDVEEARRIYAAVLQRGGSERVRQKLAALTGDADPRIAALERFLAALGGGETR